ncbi:hypothetical protein EYM_07195 [Ignicoccus islandicus DSM 13165]|uniref:Amidohydrolase-related domain-containing protein n=1 Tax=Ignicoccus islandicus DSM 13165 TaxID=940295 RepID=A0A0U3FLN5_9CREN|nr:amidohydrolase family protein [Ignicoccus islandicus]ALU12758.1 hypothetical protein EYM_07195 [Ignicoccus islandicus DSM 13165]
MEEEGYSILITDATIVTEPGQYLKGYLYIDKGRIVAIGEGEVPEEYSFATYLINGKNKIVYPGLILPLIKASSYPSRFGGKEASNFEELYYATQMAIHDLSLAGVTAFGTVEEVVEPVVRAVVNSYSKAVIFVNADVEGWKRQLDIMLNKWQGYQDRVYTGIYTETDNKDAIEIAEKYSLPLISKCCGIKLVEEERIASERGIVKLEKNGVISYGFKRSSRTVNPLNVLRTLYYIGMDPVEVMRYVTTNAALILGLNDSGAIKVGYSADIVIFDVSQPPGWTAGKGLPEEVILTSNPRVETLIVRGEVIADSFEMLSIGVKDVKRARNLFGER